MNDEELFDKDFDALSRAIIEKQRAKEAAKYIVELVGPHYTVDYVCHTRDIDLATTRIIEVACHLEWLNQREATLDSDEVYEALCELSDAVSQYWEMGGQIGV